MLGTFLFLDLGANCTVCRSSLSCLLLYACMFAFLFAYLYVWAHIKQVHVFDKVDSRCLP